MCKEEETKPDAIQESIGDFGRWQASISVLMSLLKLPIAWFQLSIIILEANMDHWCTRPTHLANMSVEAWKEVSHPKTSKGYDVCNIYNQSFDNFMYIKNFSNEDMKTIECRDWEFDRSVFQSNMISEWNLLCGNSQLANVVQATFMLGVLLGNVLFGILADKHGRKIPLMVAIFLQTFCGVASALVPWLSAFIIFRFVLALATGGTMIISFVLLMEIVGDKWRTTVAILYQIPFSFGICIMSGVSFLLRDWRQFQLALSLISAVFLVYWWFIPESPRWLLTVGREEEAVAVLEKAAHYNRRDVNAVQKAVNTHKESADLKEDRRGSVADLMKTPNLRRNTLILFYNWFASGLSFFALSQILGNVGENIFLTIVVAGVIGIPGSVGCIYVVKIGRKNTIMLAEIVAGLSSLLIILFPKGVYAGEWPRILLAATSLTGMSLYFPALYLFSGELFPTVVRNVGVGSASMFSRIGSILAPFVKSLASRGEFWPLMIVGCGPVIGAFLIFFLPETKNCRLPDTLEDGENFGKKTNTTEESQISSTKV